LQGKRFELIIYLSLAPVVLGVTLASVSDLNFSLTGLTAALGSALAQTLLNITSKRRMEQLGVNGSDAQFLMATWCFLASVPMYFLQPQQGNSHGPLSVQTLQCPIALGVTILAGTSYHIEYVLNFMFVPLVSPLAFSVTDIARRLTKIILGALFFHSALTVPNAVGVALSLCGVLWYSCLTFKSNQEQAARRKFVPLGTKFL